LNTSTVRDTTDPALFVGQAASAPFAVLNTILRDTTDPALFIGQATSAPFAVLNTSSLRDTTDPKLFVGKATSAPFAVLNTTNLNDTTAFRLFIGEVVSPFFVVRNTATQSIVPTTPSAPAVATTMSMLAAAAADGVPQLAIAAPASGATVFEGQTI